MRRQLIILHVVLIIAAVLFSGCKKRETKTEPEAEYKSMAEKEITKDNMQSELDKLEKSLNEDIASEE